MRVSLVSGDEGEVAEHSGDRALHGDGVVVVWWIDKFADSLLRILCFASYVEMGSIKICFQCFKANCYFYKSYCLANVRKKFERFVLHVLYI